MVAKGRNVDWEDKKNVCYKLYVEQRKTPAEIVAYFAELFKIDEDELPGPRAFSRQFKLWNFPHRLQKLPVDQEPVVAARLRELWEQNIPRTDIQRIVAEEGFRVNHHVFCRLWRSQGLKLRVPKTSTAEGENAPPDTNQDNSHVGASIDPNLDGRLDPTNASESTSRPPEWSAEQQAQRDQRAAEIMAKSDRNFEARKRRRRIRGLGMLPPDAPGLAPRYASETSLDECKAFLGFTNEIYNAVRDQYEPIARELNILRKSDVDAHTWDEGKRRLVQNNAHLSAVLHPYQPDLDKKANALECICVDVLKRIRSQQRILTIPQANALLSLNPGESRAIRESFYAILEADHFDTKTLCGEEHWNELCAQWHTTSPVLQQAVASQDMMQMRAVNRLSKEAVKRYRGDKFQHSSGQKEQYLHYGPGPGPAYAVSRPANKAHPPPLAAQAPPQAAQAQDAPAPATALPPPPPPQPAQRPPMHEPHVRAAVVGRYPPPTTSNLITTAAQATGPIDSTPPAPLSSSSSSTLAAYVRLSPATLLAYPSLPRIWLARLSSPSLLALYAVIQTKLHEANASHLAITQLEGVVTDAQGQEDCWRIDGQDEFAAFCDECGGKKATLVITLAG